MEINSALIDTNVCLDAALQRAPFSVAAIEIIERSQLGEFSAMIAAHSFDTLFYFLRKDKNTNRAYYIINEFRSVFKVAPVTQQVIDDALNARWNDFEDAIHYQAAKAADCDAIITRNKKDFKDADLPVLSPQEFLAQFNDEEE